MPPERGVFRYIFINKEVILKEASDGNEELSPGGEEI